MKIRNYTVVQDTKGVWRAGCVRFAPEDVKAVLYMITKSAAAVSKMRAIPFASDSTKLRTGMWCCISYGGEVVRGRILIDPECPGDYFILQNNPSLNGYDRRGTIDKMGFMYSWIAGQPFTYDMAVYDQDPARTGELTRYKEWFDATSARYETKHGTKVKVADTHCVAGGITIGKPVLGKLMKYVSKQ